MGWREARRPDSPPRTPYPHPHSHHYLGIPAKAQGPDGPSRRAGCARGEPEQGAGVRACRSAPLQVPEYGNLGIAVTLRVRPRFSIDDPAESAGRRRPSIFRPAINGQARRGRASPLRSPARPEEAAPHEICPLAGKGLSRRAEPPETRPTWWAGPGQKKTVLPPRVAVVVPFRRGSGGPGHFNTSRKPPMARARRSAPRRRSPRPRRPRGACRRRERP